jgi:hypothetical protein
MRNGILFIFCLACGISLTRSLWLDLLLIRTDTRVLAGQYIQENVSVDTPVVYLCGPESEPQVPENTDSLLRRMEYVDRRYGEEAGDFISRLYRDLMQRPDIDSRGWSIYRFPDPEEIAFEEPIVMVTATHPLALGNTSPDLISRWAGEPLLTRDFISIQMTETAVFDRIDGFFLPFTELWKVKRPGPNLRVTILKWSSSHAESADKFLPGSESTAR